MNLEVVCVIVLVFVVMSMEINGHGMLLVPPGRSSRWRYDRLAPKNYNDNSLNCGGFYNHHSVNGGKCGICGDDYGLPMPRPNEVGGRFGQGVIVKDYFRNVLNVGAHITANHLGYFEYELCNLDVAGEEYEGCFVGLTFADGNDRLYVGTYTGIIYAKIVIPNGTKCKHCVLRWVYTAGNNWGICENGSGGIGCGSQETFKTCADIAIDV